MIMKMLSVGTYRTFAGALAWVLFAAAFNAPVNAQFILYDEFAGNSVNASVWGQGSTGSTGISAVGSGLLTLDANRTTTGRNQLLTQSTNFNPFDRALTIHMSGLSLNSPGSDGDTAASGSNALTAIVGRLPDDVGGAATGALAATYSTGGGGYYASGGTGGALGLSILRFEHPTAPYRLQVLDTGGIGGVGAVRNVLGNVNLSAMPSGLTWTINGAENTFTIELEGALFTSGPGNATNMVTGTIENFSEEVLMVGDSTISRFAIGSNVNGNVYDGAVSTFDTVSVIPEPSTYAVFVSLIVFGVVVYRRRRRMIAIVGESA